MRQRLLGTMKLVVGLALFAGIAVLTFWRLMG
jgi:hypothetical protein